MVDLEYAYESDKATKKIPTFHRRYRLVGEDEEDDKGTIEIKGKKYKLSFELKLSLLDEWRSPEDENLLTIQEFINIMNNDYKP